MENPPTFTFTWCVLLVYCSMGPRWTDKHKVHLCRKLLGTRNSFCCCLVALLQ